MRKMFAVALAAPDRCPAISRQFVRLPAGPGSDSCGLMTDASHDGADRAPRQGDRLVLGPLGETQMRNIILAAIALMLAGVGVLVWATLTTQARIDVPAGAQINPLQIMMGAGDLPVAHYDDYSLVFPN